MKIELLDLYCGAGGCAFGYASAAKELGMEINITGIDNEPQKNYPYKFIQSNAIEYLNNNYKRFTHGHASPPCQKYSASTGLWRKRLKYYSDDLEKIKPLLYSLKLLAVIENVMPAPIRGDVILRGDMFGLKVLRKRKFELVNWFMLRPGIGFIKPGAISKRGEYITCIGKGNLGTMNKENGAYVSFIHKKESTLKTWSFAMGIDWMTVDEMAQAIPPAYTKYIGMHFFTLKN